MDCRQTEDKLTTSLPQAPAFRRHLASADDGAKRNFTPVGYECARLSYIADTLRYPGYVPDWPLETPFGGISPLDTHLLWLRAGAWHGLVGDDDRPFAQLVDRLRASVATALAWFDEFRFPPWAIDPRTGWEVWPEGVSHRRLPAAVHREARRLTGELTLPWNWHVIERPPDIEHLGEQRGDLELPLQFSHLVALAALILLSDAADVVATERRRLETAFHRLAPGVRIEAGWRNQKWRDAAQRIVDDEVHQLRTRRALTLTEHLRERAIGWLKAWTLRAEAGSDALEMAERAAKAEIEAARRARQEAAAYGAKLRTEASIRDSREKIAAAYRRLLPEQQGRYASTIIARALAMHPRTVREHLKALNLLSTKRKGR